MHELAADLGVEVRGATGNVNKGWAGHVFEHYLGLAPNSDQSPDFGSWELKVIPLVQMATGKLRVKETMAITMIDAVDVARTPFEQSHLLSKLQKAIVVARIVGSDVDDPSVVHSVNELNLEGELFDQVRRDYEEVRRCLKDPSQGFGALSGSMGTYVQPRTKGAGHGSISRAFYARPVFIEKIVKL